MQGEHIKAQAHYEEALSLWRELGDRECVAIMLIMLANLQYHYGDLMTARSMCNEAISLSREISSKPGVADSLSLSAEIELSQGNLAAARQLSEEAVTRSREMDNKGGLAWQLSILARVEARLGNYARARHRYEELLPLVREVDDKELNALILEGLAGVLVVQGEGIRAARLLGAAEFVRQSYGIPLSPADRMVYEQAVAAARAQLGEQAFNIAWAEGRTMTLEQVLAAQGLVTHSTPTLKGQTSTNTGKSSPHYPNGM